MTSETVQLESATRYTIGWITALSLELTASVAVLDHKHRSPKGFKAQSGDNNVYQWGAIGQHHVVIVCLPVHSTGVTSAKTTILNMQHSLPDLRFCLLVGIAAGLPRIEEGKDVRLGDVVVGIPTLTSPGVIQYDMGKMKQSSTSDGYRKGTFERVGSLNRPPELLLRAIQVLQARHRLEGSNMGAIVRGLVSRYPRLGQPGHDGTASYTYPGVRHDKLFHSGSQHNPSPGLAIYETAETESCADCDISQIIERRQRESTDPQLHFGTIASGNMVIKDAMTRDDILRRLDGNCLCLEMEAAGVMDIDKLPCLVVRGICDYGDAHKNDAWQPYAAAAAAAYVKELLDVLEGEDVEALETMADVIQDIKQTLFQQRDILESQDLRQIWTDLSKVDGAAYNSQADEQIPVCFEGTRKDVLSYLQKWSSDPSAKPICWLYGEAGTGKSTIARTIAASWDERGMLGASFFFDRNERQRSRKREFVSTIAAQMAAKFLWLRQPVSDALKADPLLADKALAVQYKSLLLEPLRTVAHLRTFQPPLIIVIDALDECETIDDMQAIIQALAMRLDHTPLRIFITSRPEDPIIREFRGMQLGGHSDDVDLYKVTQSTVRKDIRAYLKNELVKARKGVNHIVEMPETWPGESMIESMTELATPLFIVAATWCRFIAQAGVDPIKRTERILHEAKNTSLDQPGRTYSTVLKGYMNTSDEEDREDRIQAFKCIVGTLVLLFQSLSANALARLVAMDFNIVRLRLYLLRSIIRSPEEPGDPVRAFHLSLRDFLTAKHTIPPSEDQLHRLYIDETAQHKYIAEQCIALLSQPGVLKRDLGGKSTPGTLRQDITTDVVRSVLPEAVSYACSYWAEHYCLSKPLGDEDQTRIYDFLLCHFLHWLEALSWLGRLSDGILQIKALASLCQGSSSAPHLAAFLHDAKRFVLWNRNLIEEMPSQIYASALVFAPSRSIVRTTYQNEMPRWISTFQEIGVSSGWGTDQLRLDGHEGCVNSVCFSPDGKQVVSASDDWTVRLWNAETGATLLKLKGHKDSVNSVCFSPDGKQVASASRDETVRLWNAETGATLLKLKGHEGWVNSVCFSPDGKQVASASGDWTVRPWNAETGATLLKLKGHENWVNSVCFSPDGKQVASASDDGTVRLWNAETEGPVETVKFEGHENVVNCVCFSPDGKQVVSASSDDGTVRLWNAETEGPVETVKFESSVYSVCFSPDGKQIATASYGEKVHIWNAETGAEQLELEVGGLTSTNSVFFSPDGKQLATALDDDTVCVWNTESGKPEEIFSRWSIPLRFDSDSAAGTGTAIAVSDEWIEIAGVGCERS